MRDLRGWCGIGVTQPQAAVLGLGFRVAAGNYPRTLEQKFVELRQGYSRASFLRIYAYRRWNRPAIIITPWAFGGLWTANLLPGCGRGDGVSRLCRRHQRRRLSRQD